MKKIIGLLGLATVLCGTVRAQTTLTAWTFDNVSVGINSTPPPSTGLGTAGALGMGNTYNHTNSISNPDVQSLSGSSSGGANGWRVRGYSTVNGNGGNGWSTNAPIGTQGAEFAGSTFGFYQIKVSFDVYATPDAEAKLQVQYTTDGSVWNNATITSAGTLGTLLTNTDSPDTVMGTYVKLGGGWNNQITVDLSGISGVDNDANFAIRLVNASTGADCADTTGAVYNDSSGNWTFDNVVIGGRSIDTIADWTFDNYPSSKTIVFHPSPVIGSGTASSIGFNNSYTYADGGTGSTNGPDVTAGDGFTSSGSAGPNVWRVRGNPGENGWNTAAPIGAQGSEYDVDTSGYSNIICSFDLYSTSQGEAKMCVLYTTNGWVTTNIAQSIYGGAYPQLMQTNPPVISGGSADTVAGTYFYDTVGQGDFNNFVVDFTGLPGVADNPLFGFRIVNAATGSDCVNYTGGAYNNSSGNWRFDNVVVGGTAGQLPPAITADPNASVDRPFTNTFTDDPTWRSKIAAIYVNGTSLTNTAYNTSHPGMLLFTPANSALLKSSGLKNIIVVAPGYGTAKVAQPLAAGIATRLAITTQAAGPSASGGTLTVNPVLAVLDQYGNSTTNPYANVSVAASVGDSGGWTLGGDTIQASVNGVMAFTNLTATVNGSSAVPNAFITFAITGYAPLTVTNSAVFNIGPPPVPFTPGNLAVLQLDTVANNTTFSVIELKPSEVGQAAPVNVVPISATGTNGLRLSSSGSCGKLSLSGDGRLIGFAAFQDDSAATPDETFNYNRAAAGLNYAGQLVTGLRYTSTSLNGSQARSAATLDDEGWLVDDKGGLYLGDTNSGVISSPNLNDFNNVVVRAFGGNYYVETQKTANGEIIPAVYGLTNFEGQYYIINNNLITDPNASDFYMVSTNGGASYDVLYILDGISATEAILNKYSWVAGADPNNPNGQYGWGYNGSFTNTSGADSLFATTNGIGGIYLYYTTGESVSNRLVRLTDASGWNGPINITFSNVLYRAAGNTYLKGITFVPQQATNAPELVPPPILSAQNGALAGSPFTVTCAPDDSAWRSGITTITVNGTTLSPAAYDTTQSGEIVFHPSQSALLQSAGAKTMVISSTGYSRDTVVQNLSVLQSILNGVTLSNGDLEFSFTNGAGLSFSVLATNNLTAPLSSWPLLGTAVENPSGSGHYQFTSPNPATNSAEYFILRQP